MGGAARSKKGRGVRRAPGVRKATKRPILSPAEIDAVRAMVIGEDRRVIAFDKPAGLSSQGGRGQANTLDELVFAFERHGERPRLVHRLDRDTSGVILAAKSRAAAGFLGKAIQDRRVEKTYLALLAASPDPAEGEIVTALRREEIGREAYMRACAADHPDAETALTRYRTLAAGQGAALVELQPHTGRMHQLRVHLASIGRAIVGDVRYGGALTLNGEAVPRLMLHARALEFPHPDGGRTRIEAEPPEDFARMLAAAGLTDGSGAEPAGGNARSPSAIAQA